MCGRFTLYSSKDQIKRQFDAQVPLDFDPNYNISPGQTVIALVGDNEKKSISTTTIEWGIKPQWGSTNIKFLINARA